MLARSLSLAVLAVLLACGPSSPARAQSPLVTVTVRTGGTVSAYANQVSVRVR
jgi:multidrug efflux pump subunit AcrA (membrane-fusion protein)